VYNKLFGFAEIRFKKFKFVGGCKSGDICEYRSLKQSLMGESWFKSLTGFVQDSHYPNSPSLLTASSVLEKFQIL
jgi:hypothetical protein